MVKDEQINIILEKHPSLTFNSRERFFSGYVQIDEDDKYNLKIDINNTSNFPRVYELDDRIPQKADRHVNGDNSLCFTTKANELIQLKTKVKDLNLDQEIFQNELTDKKKNKSNNVEQAIVKNRS